MEYTWSFVLVAFGCLCEGAIDVTNREHVCLSEQTTITLSCPPSHALSIDSATYHKSHEPGCHAHGDDQPDCLVADVGRKLFLQCYPHTNCTIDLVQSPSSLPNQPCPGSSGDTYINIIYKCYPATSDKTLSMCGEERGEEDGEEAWEGSMLYLWSPLFPTMTNTHGCGCTITMQEDLEIEIRIPDFKHQGAVINEPPYSCSPALDFWSPYDDRTVCSYEHNTDEKIEFSRRHSFSVAYRNPSMVGARLMIMLQVHHDYKFQISCRSNFTLPTPTSSLDPVTPDIMTSTQQPVVSGSTTREQHVSTPNPHAAKMAEESKVVPLIAIAVAVAGVIVVLIILLLSVVFYCRRKKRRQNNKPDPAELNRNVFENNLYMSANQVTRGQGQSQGQAQPQGQAQGQGSSEVGAEAAQVTFESLPSKPGFVDVRFENEPMSQKEVEIEEEFDEVTIVDEDSKTAESNGAESDRPRQSVRDRIRQFEL